MGNLAGSLIRFAFALGLLAIFFKFYYFVASLFYFPTPSWVYSAALLIPLCWIIILYRVDVLGRTERLLAVEELRKASSFPLGGSTGSHLLVIRAIDDEAALVIALGAVMNRLIRGAAVLIFVILSTFIAWWGADFAIHAVSVLHGHQYEASKVWVFVNDSIFWLLYSLTALFVGICVARAVYGREMALAPLDCQVNSQSAPDATALSRLVTLPGTRREFRHMIYDHPQCTQIISSWLSSHRAIKE